MTRMTSSISHVKFQPFEDDDDSWEELSSESIQSDEETCDETLLSTCVDDTIIEDSSVGTSTDVPMPVVFWRRDTARYTNPTVDPLGQGYLSSAKGCDILRVEDHHLESFSITVKLQKKLTELTLAHEDTLLYHLEQVNQELSGFGKSLSRAEHTVHVIPTELGLERLQRELVVELKQKRLVKEFEKKYKEAKAVLQGEVELLQIQRDESDTTLEKVERSKEDLSCFWDEHVNTS
jgi:hypothetical protein